MDGILAMKSAQFQLNYTMAVASKAMENQELALQELVEMLPDQPAPSKGNYIDVYA